MRLSILLAAAALAVLPSAAAQTMGVCAKGTATGLLDAADAIAPVSTYGTIFAPDDGRYGYFVPAASGHSPVYVLGVSAGGRLGGEVRVAGARFVGDYWPGPLGPDATLPAEGCAPYDRVWVISQLDLFLYRQSGTPSKDLAEWPVGLGAPAVDASGRPIVTSDRSRLIDLAAGEWPVVSGRQVAFWILNDVGNTHTQAPGAPLGVEVQVLAVVPQAEALAQATVYRYRFVNRNTKPIEDFRTLIYTDFDLGNGGDDFVGSDSTRQMMYVYNGTNADGVYGIPPAAGVDVLSGAASSPFIFKSGISYYSEPQTTDGYYCTMQGLFRDCSSMREGNQGLGPSGRPILWYVPGDPVRGAFWSMRNVDGTGRLEPNGDKRASIATAARTLAPGASADIVFAVLFAQGANHLDSVVRLRGVSDAAQAAYDAGTLFDVGSPVAPAAVASPALASPADDASIVNDGAMLMWDPVAGATRYRVQTSLDPSFAEAETTDVRSTSIYGPFYPADGTLRTVYWRVRAFGPDAVGPYSEARSYRVGADYTLVEFVGGGAGIVETTRPGRDVCAGDEADVGCRLYGGNTVYLNGDISGDYFVSGLFYRDVGVLYPGGAAEMRFTEAGGIGVYFDGHILSVPFELWNLGTDAGPTDDVRMIPVLGFGEGTTLPILDSWADQYIRTYFAGDGVNPVRPRTVSVSFMQPKPSGSYAAFEADALAFGGPGATYDSNADRDTEVALNPTTGAACENQGFYVDYCYHNDSPYLYFSGGSPFIQPIRQAYIVDLAGDGTTPPAGTTIRFQVASPVFVAEAPAPLASRGALGAPFPNPARASARVPFETAQEGHVRLAVVDLLGRTIAVLVDEAVAAGAHEARVPTGLAPGVYVVVLDAPGGLRATRRITVVR